MSTAEPTTDATQPRYKMRADAFFVKNDNGVWIRNNRGSFSMNGASAYPLVKLLFGKLHDGATVDEICGNAPAEKRRAIEAVLQKLDRHGFLKVIRTDLAEDIPPWAATLYADQLGFIDHYLDTPYAHFTAFRDKRIVAMGDETVLRAIVTALAEYGASDVVLSPAGPPGGATLAALADAAVRRDPGASFRLAPEGRVADAADCTLLALDADQLRATPLPPPRTDRAVVAAVVRIDDRLVVTGPLRADAAICLECLVRSLPRAATRAESVPSVAASLAANQLAFGVFSHFVGLPSDADSVVRIIDCSTLSVRVHRVLPHSLCERHQGSTASTPVAVDAMTLAGGSPALVRPDLPSGLDGADLVAAQDALATLIGRWCDSVTGPLLRVGEGELPQLPLAASECVAQELGAHAHGSRRFVCRGLSARETRSQAALLALEWMAESLLAQRPDDARRGLAPLALGAGWSLEEAAYRALHHATLAMTLPASPSPTEIADDALRAAPETAYLVELLHDRAPGRPLTVSAVKAPTGLYVASARLASETGTASGRGAGVSALAASLQALLALAIEVTSPAESARAANLAFQVTSWSASLEAASAAWAPELGLAYRALPRVFPFSSGEVHVVALVKEPVDARG